MNEDTKQYLQRIVEDLERDAREYAASAARLRDSANLKDREVVKSLRRADDIRALLEKAQ